MICFLPQSIVGLYWNVNPEKSLTIYYQTQQKKLNCSSCQCNRERLHTHTHAYTDGYWPMLVSYALIWHLRKPSGNCTQHTSNKLEKVCVCVCVPVRVSRLPVIKKIVFRVKTLSHFIILLQIANFYAHCTHEAITDVGSEKASAYIHTAGK